MRKMRKTILTTALMATALLNIGCQSQEFADGYQFGDATRFAGRELLQLESARRDYCDQTKTSELRQAALAMIRQKVPEIPEQGICANPEQALSQRYPTAIDGATLKPIDPKSRDSPDG